MSSNFSESNFGPTANNYSLLILFYLYLSPDSWRGGRLWVLNLLKIGYQLEQSSFSLRRGILLGVQRLVTHSRQFMGSHKFVFPWKHLRSFILVHLMKSSEITFGHTVFLCQNLEVTNFLYFLIMQNLIWFTCFPLSLTSFHLFCQLKLPEGNSSLFTLLGNRMRVQVIENLVPIS